MAERYLVVVVMVGFGMQASYYLLQCMALVSLVLCFASKAVMAVMFFFYTFFVDSINSGSSVAGWRVRRRPPHTRAGGRLDGAAPTNIRSSITRKGTP